MLQLICGSAPEAAARCLCPRLASRSHIFRTHGALTNWQTNFKLLWSNFIAEGSRWPLRFFVRPLLSCQETSWPLTNGGADTTRTIGARNIQSQTRNTSNKMVIDWYKYTQWYSVCSDVYIWYIQYILYTPREWNNSRSSTAGGFWLAVAPCLLQFGTLYVLNVRLDHLRATGRRTKTEMKKRGRAKVCLRMLKYERQS